MRHSRPGVHWYAIRKRYAGRSRITRLTITSRSARPTTLITVLKTHAVYVPLDVQSNRRKEKVEAYLDVLNRELLDRLQRSGETFVSNAVIEGRYLLRACIVNFHTTQTDVEVLPAIVTRIGHTVDAELRK